MYYTVLLYGCLTWTVMLCSEKVANQNAKSLTEFVSNNIYFCKCQKRMRKKSKEDEQTLEASSPVS